jgi:hypothetical protein
VGINNTIRNAMRNRWALTDEFLFTFNNTKYHIDPGELTPQDFWDIHTMNIDTPQFSAGVNDIVIGGTRRLYTSLFDSFTISVTFRESEGMGLKEYFDKIWAAQGTYYFDEIKSTIQVSSFGSTIFHSDDILISNISQTQLSYDNNQILEFTVSFVCTSFSTNTLGQFGKPGHTNLK